MDGPDHVFLVSGPVIPGNDHPAAYGDAAEKAYNEKGEVSPGADGGESLVCGKIAQDPGVGQIIELLKQLSEKQRQSKGKNTLGDGPLSERFVPPPEMLLEN